MRKVSILVVLLFLLSACTKTDASFEVIKYLNKFKNHDEEVISSLHKLAIFEEISLEEQNLYELVMKRQYTDLEYKIKEEHYNGDEAYIGVDISVYDYEESKNRAMTIIKNEPQKYDTKEKILNLELQEMEKEEKRIFYTIDFEVAYEKGKWKLKAPSKEILEKIHGIYAYGQD